MRNSERGRLRASSMIWDMGPSFSGVRSLTDFETSGDGGWELTQLLIYSEAGDGRAFFFFFFSFFFLLFSFCLFPFPIAVRWGRQECVWMGASYIFV